MHKLPETKTTSYSTGHEDFIIDIVETEDMDGEPMFETWLYRENTGMKSYVVGEYKKAYPGMDTYQYARHIIKYIRTVSPKGYTHYDMYDEEIEDLEKACWLRIEQERKAAALTGFVPV